MFQFRKDIKGGNILVQEDGTCKISDFGLSKLNDQEEVYDQNSKMSLQGSIFWMAPEVVKNEPYSAKVDIWSLGCTVIEMYTGKRPWLDLTALAAVYSVSCIISIWQFSSHVYSPVLMVLPLNASSERVNHHLYPKISLKMPRISFDSASSCKCISYVINH